MRTRPPAPSRAVSRPRNPTCVHMGEDNGKRV